jgi:O-antigen ligase
MAVLLLAAAVAAGDAGDRVWHRRATLASPSRSDATTAALDKVRAHPLTGAGPGHAVVSTRTDVDTVHVQQYLHDEYLQVLTEYGAVGALALLALLAGLARLLWRHRPVPAAAAVWAGAVAACTAALVQAASDFVWHLPVVPLTLTSLIGLAIAPAARMSRAAAPEGGTG